MHNIKVNYYKIIFVAKKYINYPKYILPSELVSILSMELPVFLFVTLFTNSTVGFYALAVRIITTPINLIAKAVGNVFRREANELYRENGDCKNLVVKTTKTLFMLGIIPFSQNPKSCAMWLRALCTCSKYSVVCSMCHVL